MRLNFIVEGATEKGFVDSVLAEHFGARGWKVCARSIDGGRYGAFKRWRRDLRAWMREDQNSDVRFTTMLDLYGLPEDFPTPENAAALTDPYGRVSALETVWARDIDDPRFVPYIQLHEYEALLFADVEQLLHEFPNAERGVRQLRQVVESIGNPELIDAGQDTAPSKRIIGAIPEYRGRKASSGPLVAKKIGLATLRQRCRHFDTWLGWLEALR
jgi:hypothetical protein